ncbi:peptidase inhibitor family I36 protein [Devosia sp. A449]
MRRFLTALASLLTLLLLSQAPAFAAPEVAGTHAWSRQPLVLYNGPGAQYAITGQLPALVAIKAMRCQKLWCLVDGAGGRGWTPKHGVAFGQPPGTPRPPYAGGSGSVCFYQGANYTGAALCVPSGRVIDDLALLGLDNSFASVKIDGPVSAAACRDRFFQSYCERITASQPTLDRYLRRALSSIRVY